MVWFFEIKGFINVPEEISQVLRIALKICCLTFRLEASIRSIIVILEHDDSEIGAVYWNAPAFIISPSPSFILKKDFGRIEFETTISETLAVPVFDKEDVFHG
jgi:hypothetical protein